MNLIPGAFGPMETPRGIQTHRHQSTLVMENKICLVKQTTNCGIFYRIFSNFSLDVMCSAAFGVDVFAEVRISLNFLK